MSGRAEQLYQRLTSGPAAILVLIGKSEDVHLESKEWRPNDGDAQTTFAKATCPGTGSLKLVPQRELHDARLSQQTRVGAEIVRRLRKRSQQSRRSHRLSVEAREIGHVKYIPPELHAVTFPVRHLPALEQAHVPLGEAVPTQDVARADLAGKGQGEVLLRRGGISKNVDASVFLESACSGFRSHLSDRSEEPVRRPALATVHAEGESAGPASHSGSLPATDESVQQATGVAGQCATFANG